MTSPGAGHAGIPSPNMDSGDTPSTPTTETCLTCGKPRTEHPFRHPFNSGELSGMAVLGVSPGPDGRQVPATVDEVEVVEQPWPFDPVLRQALVDKGLLTADDLRAAERKIRDMSAIFNGRPS